MASDYGEHLDATSLRLLAEATGFAFPGESSQVFESRPNDIKLALASPAAARLLDLNRPTAQVQHHLLQLAIAVHQTAEDICQAGWIATNESAIDLELISFSGQTQHQHFIVGLLASFLRTPAPAVLPDIGPVPLKGTDARLRSLIELCSQASPAERPGAMRLLGDEALFSSGVCPSVAHQLDATPALVDSLSDVLPKAVVGLMDDLKPQLHSLLDVYLTFGPVWYRMAAQKLVHSESRATLDAVASNFTTARRFIVQVNQGPLKSIKDDLYPALG